MSAIIDQLRNDHKNMSQVLDLLAREIRLFRDEKPTDFELIESILDYVLNYPDINHHPTEDLVLDKLRERDPEAAAGVGPQEQEHMKLAALTRRFSAAVKNVIMDETLPRDWFLDVAMEYLTAQRRHMQMEEVVFFPLAIRTLTKEDWQDVEAKRTVPLDPLFGELNAEKYERLHSQVKEWSLLFREGPRPRASHLQR